VETGSEYLAGIFLMLLFRGLFNEQLGALPVFWRVLVTTLCMTPVLSFVCIPNITRMLGGWLLPARRKPLSDVSVGGARPT